MYNPEVEAVDEADAAKGAVSLDLTAEDVATTQHAAISTDSSVAAWLDSLQSLSSRLPEGAIRSPPLRLPNLPRFVASAAPVRSGPLHAMMMHCHVGFEHGSLAQWYAPPAVESPWRRPQSGGEVVDDCGPCLHGPHFKGWMGALRLFLLALADRLRGSEPLDIPVSTMVSTITAVAQFCAFAPWSDPGIYQAAQRLFCALTTAINASASASSTAGSGSGRSASHVAHHRIAAAAGGGSSPRQHCCLCSDGTAAPLHPFLVTSASPFTPPRESGAAKSNAARAPGDAASGDRCAPLVEPHTCADVLVAAFADELLQHVRARMRGSDWCSRTSNGVASRYVAHWIITSLRSPHWTTERVGTALPVLLKLCDRWEATNVWLGASGLVHLFMHAAAADLRLHRDVILAALGRCRSQKQPTAAATVAYARAMALPVLFGPAPGMPSLGAGAGSGPSAALFRAVAASPMLASGLPGGSAEAVELLATSLGQGPASAAAGGPYAHFILEVAQDLALATGSPGIALGQLAVLPLPIALLGERAGPLAPALVPPLARLLLESSDGRTVAAAAHVLSVLATAAPGAFRIAADEAEEALAAVPALASPTDGSSALPAAASLSGALDSVSTAGREAAVAAGSAAAVAETIHHRLPASPAQLRSAQLRGRRDLVDQILAGANAAREQLLMGLVIARESDIAADETPGEAGPGTAASTAADVSAAAVLGVDGEDGLDGRLRRPLTAVLAVLDSLVAAVSAAAPEYTAAAVALMREHLAAALQV